MRTNDEIRRLNLLVAIGRVGSAARLADLASTSPAYLSQIKNRVADSKSGTPKAMGDELARRIEAALHVPTGWMDSPHHSVWVDAGLIEEQSKGAAAPVDTAELPGDAVDIRESSLSIEDAQTLIPGALPLRVVSSDDPALTHLPKVKLRLSAGISGVQVEPERFDGSTMTVPTEWIVRNGYDPAMLVVIRIGGDSMEPTLYDGDLGVVNLADTRPVDGRVYAFNYEGEPVVKRLSRDAGQWWMTSDNPDQRKYHRKTCQGNDCIIVGRVIQKVSERL